MLQEHHTDLDFVPSAELEPASSALYPLASAALFLTSDSAMAASFVTSPLGKKLEAVSTRSLFVRVYPRPNNLGERRAVLRALQKYAPVEVFKKLAVRTN